jgi:hypothetical protein
LILLSFAFSDSPSMMITRVGLLGPMAAYPPFLAKTAHHQPAASAPLGISLAIARSGLIDIPISRSDQIALRIDRSDLIDLPARR